MKNRIKVFFLKCIVRGTIKSYLSFVVEFVAVNSKWLLGLLSFDWLWCLLWTFVDLIELHWHQLFQENDFFFQKSSKVKDFSRKKWKSKWKYPKMVASLTVLRMLVDNYVMLTRYLCNNHLLSLLCCHYHFLCGRRCNHEIHL